MHLLFVLLPLLLEGSVIREDFLVHPDLPYKCKKEYPSVAALPQGWVVVWTDARNGKTDIFGQILSPEGTRVDSNFMVNVPAGAYRDETGGRVVSNRDGNFLVLWTDQYGIRGGIWLGRRFSASGEPQSDEQIILEDAFILRSAMNEKGEHVRVWWEINIPPPWFYRFQAFNADDTPKGEEQPVVIPDARFDCVEIAISSDGSSAVVWNDKPEDVDQVFARCYDSCGLPKGDSFQVSVSGPTSYAAVGMEAGGSFVVAWIKQDTTTGDAIYFRRYYSSGTPKAAPQLLKEFPAEIEVKDLKIGVTDDGSFALCWSDNHSGKYQVYLQCYAASGSKQGSELAVGADTQADYMQCALAIHGDDWFAGYTKGVYTYEEDGTEYFEGFEIVGRRGTLAGTLSGDEVLISDDESSADQTVGQVFADDEGRFVFLWQESVPGDTSTPACGRRFSLDGEALGEPFPVHYGLGSMNRATGEFAVTWRDEDSLVVYVQRYSMDGQAQGSPIRVNPQDEEVRYINRSQLDISLCRSGSFAVIWLQEIEGMEERLIVARRFDADDNPLDVDAVVASDSAIGPGSPDIVMRDDKNFIVTWHDYRIGAGGDVFARRFDASGNPVGDDFEVNEDTMPGILNSHQRFPCIATDDQGNFCIAWAEDDRHALEGAYAYAQFYDAEGNKLGNNVNTGFRKPSGSNYIGVAGASEGFVIFGNDFSYPDGDPEVRACYYDSQGRFIGRQQINQPDLFPYNHQLTGRNCVACTDDRIVYAWQDNRRHKGWDIFAKITDWDVPGIKERPRSEESPIQLSASLNRLSYDVPGQASLTLYSSDGRRVLEETIQGKGTWEAPVYLPQGVYFARVLADSRSIQTKLILLH